MGTTSRRTLGLLRAYLPLTVAGFVLALAHMGLGLAVPWFIRLIIDEAILKNSGRALALYGSALLLIALVRFALAFGRRLASGKMSLAIEYDLRNRLWAHLLEQPAHFYDRWPTGQLMSRAMSDVQNVRMFLGYGLVFFATNIVTMIAVAIVLFVVNWRLALASLAFLPVLLLVTVRFGRRLNPILKDVQQRLADVTAAAEESIIGSSIVRIFAREEDDFVKFAGHSRAVFHASVDAARARAIYIPLTAFLPSVAVAVLLAFGGSEVIAGRLTLGSLVAFYGYLMLLVYPAQVIGWLTGLAQRAIASATRVFEILDTPLEMANPTQPHVLRPGPDGAAVTLVGVTLTYDRRPALRDINLTVPAASTVAIVGRTGSGKSTLTALLPRFYDPDAGRVLIDGRDLRDLDLTSLRRHVGLVAQDPFLFSASVGDNLRLGRPDAPLDEVIAAAKVAAAHEFISELPEGYETIIGERGLTLSGGQRQRLALARALLVDPAVLILDDATSSVDVETEARIWRSLRSVTRRRTTVVIAHRAATIALADVVVLLEGGRIVAQGTHSDLLGSNALYSHLFAPGGATRYAGESDREPGRP